MSKPWKVRRGIYELVDDSFANRRELENHLTIKFKKDGFKPKGILYGKDKTPQRISTASQKNVVKNPEGNKLKIKVSNPETLRGSDMKQQISENATEGFRKQDIERGKEALQSRSRVGSIAKNVGKVEAHHTRMLQMYRPFFEGLSTQDRAELADFAFKSKYALGNDLSNRALLSKPFHDKIHDFMRERGYQVSSKQIKAGYKYPDVPDLGNTLDSRKNALSHFFTNVQDPIERKLNTIKWDQEDVIKPLTKKEMNYASSWFNDNERVAEVRTDRLKPNVETFEPGRRLGGIHDTMKVGGGLRRTDQALNLGTNIATGNVAGAAVGGGVLAASEILKNPAAQKAIAGQVARLGATRAGKTMMKTIPGLDVLISGGEAMSYLGQGRLDQAGIATLSGAIGWIPIVGDGAAAALDLTNTGLDISRLQGSPTQTPRKKKKIKWGNQPTTRLKFNI